MSLPHRYRCYAIAINSGQAVKLYYKSTFLQQVQFNFQYNTRLFTNTILKYPTPGLAVFF